MSLSLTDLAKEMKHIDLLMLSTQAEGGKIAARPMSNNKDVEYDGDSFFFSFEDATAVTDIARDPNVSLSLQGSKGLLGKPPIFIAVEGKGELIRDKAAFEDHWVPDLERWFKQGVDTPGLVLIKVHASLIHYWDGEDEGEIRV